MNSTVWAHIFAAVGRQAPTMACVCVAFRDAFRQPATLKVLCDTLWPGVADDEGCFVAGHLYALFRRLICAVPKWTTFRHNGVHLEAAVPRLGQTYCTPASPWS